MFRMPSVDLPNLCWVVLVEGHLGSLGRQVSMIPDVLLGGRVS